jgi:hypothetical protein
VGEERGGGRGDGLVGDRRALFGLDFEMLVFAEEGLFRRLAYISSLKSTASK